MIQSIFIRGITGVVLGLSIVITGCTKHETDETNDLPVDLFCDGDIVFRKGTGLTSQVVLAADEEGVYSHIGILKKIEGKWYVIHAVPGEADFAGDVDRVKLDAVERFFARDRASKGAVMRMDGAAEKAGHAADRAYVLYQKGILFDHKYDLNDTTQMYCTELVNHVFQKEGIDLSEGRLTPVHFPGFDGDYLLPGDIACNEKLHLIYIF